MISPRRTPRWVLLTCLWVVACGAGRRGERPPPDERVRRADSVTPRPTGTLYAAEEALADVLSAPLAYLGTGPWPGIRRMQACAFRNERVIVVLAYCSATEQQALRLDVYSPTRGRVRLYAESKGGVSKRRRADYFTFLAESEPPGDPATHLPALSLSMSFAALRAYEDARYAAFLPACFGGQELARPRAGCLGTLAPRAAEWVSQNRAFLDRASDGWYRVVREMRVLAVQHGKEPR